MKKVMFIIPALEIDAAWDPPRRAPFIGAWAMAAKLRACGHEVHYLDEAFRGGGWNNRTMFRRVLRDTEMTETPLNITWDEYQAQKMRDFRSMSASAFTARYTAFKEAGVVDRTMCRIGLSEEETLQRIAEFGPDAVGIPLVATANYLPATRLGRLIKQRFPQVRVLMGGQHITADPQSFVTANPWVDYVSDGDAIGTVEDMVHGRHLMKVVAGGFRQMVEYPMLDLDIISGTGYPAEPTHNYPSGLRGMEWMSSRGCYRDCAFCFAGRREQSVTQSEWQMIERQLDHFASGGIEEVVFQDDAWLYKAKQRFPTLLKLMKERGLSFSNNGGVEFESLSAPVAEMLASYNDGQKGRCTSLYVPFNPRAWNATTTAVGAMTKAHHNLDSLKRLREAGTYIFTSLIVGTPDQSIESYQEDLATLHGLIEAGYLDAALPLSATMLPGTVWHARNGHNIVNSQDWAGFSLFSTHHKTDFMTPQQIEACMVQTVQDLGDVQQAGPWQTAFPAC